MFDRTPFTSDEPLGVVLLGALTKRQIVAIEETHTFSQSFVNTVRSLQPRHCDNNQPVKAILPRRRIIISRRSREDMRLLVFAAL